MQPSQLIQAALDARKNAYAPYSGYKVGAALLGAGGAVYTGCNVENAAYSVCNCAERTALFKAVSEGERAFTAIAVVGGRAEETPPLSGYAMPCGVCRQALNEFSPEMTVYVAVDAAQYKQYRLAELLPGAFGPANLA